MPSKKDKGSWSGDPVAYHTASPEIEAAKFLRSKVRSYLDNREGPKGIDEAVEEWLRVRYPVMRYVPDQRTKEELAADGLPTEHWPE